MSGRRATRLIVLLCLAGAAEGGTVVFSPPILVVNPSANPLATAVVHVSAEEIDVFGAVDLLFLSDDLPLSAFDYGEDFVTATSLRAPPTTTGLDVDFAEHYLYVGGLLNAPVSSILVGTLTVDASGLAPGDYSVSVDPELDGGLSALTLGAESEPLVGSAIVRVVPEPNALVITAIGLGAFAAANRRR